MSNDTREGLKKAWDILKLSLWVADPKQNGDLWLQRVRRMEDAVKAALDAPVADEGLRQALLKVKARFGVDEEGGAYLFNKNKMDLDTARAIEAALHATPATTQAQVDVCSDECRRYLEQEGECPACEIKEHRAKAPATTQGSGIDWYAAYSKVAHERGELLRKLSAVEAALATPKPVEGETCAQCGQPEDNYYAHKSNYLSHPFQPKPVEGPAKPLQFGGWHLDGKTGKPVANEAPAQTGSECPTCGGNGIVWPGQKTKQGKVLVGGTCPDCPRHAPKPAMPHTEAIVDKLVAPYKPKPEATTDAWQPIETAPRRTEILLAWHDGTRWHQDTGWVEDYEPEYRPQDMRWKNLGPYPPAPKEQRP